MSGSSPLPLPFPHPRTRGSPRRVARRLLGTVWRIVQSTSVKFLTKFYWKDFCDYEQYNWRVQMHKVPSSGAVDRLLSPFVDFYTSLDFFNFATKFAVFRVTKLLKMVDNLLNRNFISLTCKVLINLCFLFALHNSDLIWKCQNYYTLQWFTENVLHQKERIYKTSPKANLRALSILDTT